MSSFVSFVLFIGTNFLISFQSFYVFQAAFETGWVRGVCQKPFPTRNVWLSFTVILSVDFLLFSPGISRVQPLAGCSVCTLLQSSNQNPTNFQKLKKKKDLLQSKDQNGFGLYNSNIRMQRAREKWPRTAEETLFPTCIMKYRWDKVLMCPLPKKPQLHKADGMYFQTKHGLRNKYLMYPFWGSDWRSKDHPNRRSPLDRSERIL